MGSSQSNKIYIIWIDANVNDKPSKELRDELNKYKELEVKTFTEVKSGIYFLKDKEISYKRTIVITSGRLYPEFYKALQDCIKELYVFPKIIIYTSDASKYRLGNKSYNPPSPLDDPIYNIGGVVSEKNDLKKFIETSLDHFIGNYYETIKKENLKFQIISEKNELILPMYYADKISVVSPERIKKFVEYLTKEYKNTKILDSLFSQLPITEKIPIQLLVKFWLRAYSTHLMTIKNPEDKIDPALNEKNLNDHLPIAQLLYQSVEAGTLNSGSGRKLYKGIFPSKTEWEKIKNEYDKKQKGEIPKATIYGTTFFSFYKDEETVERFKQYNLERHKIYLKLVLEGTTNHNFVKNNAIITKELAYFDSQYDDEVLFFPFSCFEISKIEHEGGNEFTLTLNYLDNYISLFEDEKSKSFKNVVKNDYSELVMNSGLLNVVDLPDWFSIVNVVKKIDDENLLNSVCQICIKAINQQKFNFADDLRKKITDDLIAKYQGYWWVNVKNERNNDFGNLKENSVMIFKSQINSGVIYIHVAKINV